MSKQSVIHAALVASLVFLSFNANSQQTRRWDKDSILNGLQHFFPKESTINFFDSINTVEPDSQLRGWRYKAIVLLPDANEAFFYFYHIGDTSIFSRLFKASVNSQIKAASTIQNESFIKLPYTDSMSNRVLVCKVGLGQNEESEFDKSISKYFKVNSNYEVRLVEVRQEEKNEPPPPPPPPPKKSKSKSKGKG